MKKILVVVLALIATLATSAYAEWKWELFNMAPFAETREKAMETRESAFIKAGLPKSVVALLMEETKKPGEKIRLVNGDKLSFMVSKGGTVHKNVVVAFVKPPVSGQIEYAAPAEKWSVMDGVRIFSVILPEICNNWSGITPAIDVSAAVTEKCVELAFNAQIGGKVRWGVASSDGPLPSSYCNAQKQGDGEWKAWYGKCDECTGAVSYLQGILGEKSEIQHKYLYAVTAKQQTFRFSEAVWKDVVYICQEYADGKRTCGVYMRPQDWKGAHSVTIKDSFWISDANCPK